MRALGKWLGRILVVLIGLVGLLFVFGPYEPVPETVTFDTAQLAGGVTPYLAAEETQFDDIRVGVEKRVIWANAPEQKTGVSVVYIHGFSASSEEIRPVPDQVASALGANLYYARLSGHGRDGDAMTEPSVQDWMEDTAEALAIGRAIGDEVIVMTTSTGGTFAALAAFDPALMAQVKGIVFVSPNFGIANPLAALLTFPAARYWIEAVGGAERSFEPHNAQHAAFWTTTYPTRAVLPMAAAVKKAAGMDYRDVDVAALFLFSPEDSVVRPDITEEVAGMWGGPMQQHTILPGEGGDPYHHVIAGDIISPNATAPTVAAILEWATSLP